MSSADETDLTILVETSSPVTTITINRPAKLNALNRSAAFGIADAIAAFDADDSQRAAVITGAGGAFSAGFDLSTFRSDDHPDEPTLPESYLAFIEHGTVKPLIGAVEGYALGGGLELALTCDVLVASRSASFGLPEVKRGLLAGGGGLLRLRERIPRNEAMALALLGVRMSAQRAYDLGLVHALVDDGTAAAHAGDLAQQIARNAPLAVNASKQVIIESRDWTQHDAFLRQSEIADAVLGSDDAQEGARAFTEKRDPLWLGR